MPPRFESPVMPQPVKLFTCTVPGAEAERLIIHIEYADMAAYGTRTTFENCNPEWKELFEATPESPDRLVSVELLTEYRPL